MKQSKLSKDVVKALPAMIAEKFGLDLAEVKRDVYGPNDPGGWGRGEAIAVVYCEREIPTPAYEWRQAEKWGEIDDALAAAGFAVHHEPVNGAVICYWEN